MLFIALTIKAPWRISEATIINKKWYKHETKIVHYEEILEGIVSQCDSTFYIHIQGKNKLYVLPHLLSCERIHKHIAC